MTRQEAKAGIHEDWEWLVDNIYDEHEEEVRALKYRLDVAAATMGRSPLDGEWLFDREPLNIVVVGDTGMAVAAEWAEWGMAGVSMAISSEPIPMSDPEQFRRHTVMTRGIPASLYVSKSKKIKAWILLQALTISTIKRSIENDST